VPVTDSPRGQGETILLVEDEASILRLVTAMLCDLGYTVLAADTVKDAIELCAAHRGEIQLLITDVVMADMNGRDLADRLSAIAPNLRRLFMSGYTAAVIAHRGVLDPGVEFIQKPFSMDELAIKVRSTLQKA
jgi:DNA-binding NtrC family response regulator